MRCERLTLVNFCQHEYLQLELPPGVLALVGPNGSGKSNILGAIRFALLGENPNAGTKVENIRVTAGLRDPSYVELTFSHREVRATVRRNLRPARPSATLTIDGDPNVVEGDTAVTARILQILEISSDVITDLVLVAQRDVFGFLDKTPAKRAEQFQKLFQVEMVSDLVKVLGDHLKSVEVPLVAADLDDLRTRLRQSQQQLQELEEQCQQLPAYEQIQAYRQSNYDLVTAYQRQQKVLSDRAAWQEELVSLSSYIKVTTTTKESLASQLAAAQQLLSSLQVAAAESQVLKDQWTQYRQQAQARAHLQDTIAKMRAELAELTPPAVPAVSDMDLSVLTMRVSELQIEESRLQQMVDSFKEGVVACPTCNTPVTSLMDVLEEAARRLPEVRQRRASAAGEVALLRQYRTDLQQFQIEQSHRQQQLSQFQEQLERLPELTQPAVDEQQIQTQLQQLQSQQDEVNRLRQQLDHCISQLSQAEARQLVLSQYLQEVQQAGEATLVTEPQMQAAQAAVTQWDSVMSQRRQLEQDLATLRVQVMQLQERICEAERTQQIAERRRSWHQLCQQLRTQLPAAAKRVAQIRLQQLETRVNDCLGLLGADFRVAAREDLSFVAQFHDGRQQRAERLSGGQQVILALVVRIELNLLLAGWISMLYLDEPTAYLDEDHIQGLEPLLTRLKTYAASHGLQVLLITHERALGPLFDKVIDLASSGRTTVEAVRRA